MLNKVRSYIKNKQLLASIETVRRTEDFNFEESLSNPSGFYLKCFKFFYTQLDEDLKEHKFFFKRNKRGFGEDAFHVMWKLLYERYDIKNFLEIGVYRGQVISLISFLAKKASKNTRVAGISPLDSAGDEVSKYEELPDYRTDIMNSFKHFNLPLPELTKAYSQEPEAVEVIKGSTWDCIYIDGSHDYEIVCEDWKNSSEAVRQGGIIVFDDSSLYTPHKMPEFSFKGHPGPSKVADELAAAGQGFKEVLRVGHNRVFEKIK